ncbi:hypothetical protein OROGR_004090 [Orobanche gracilis]
MSISSACVCLAPTENLRRVLGNRHLSAHRRLAIRSDLDANVSDMGGNLQKVYIFPPEPKHYQGLKLKVAIVGACLSGMSTAVELLDQGHEV